MPATPHARAAERIDRLSATHDDARALRLAVLEEVRRVVGFEAYAWLLTDPETEVGTAPLADVPWLAELPRQIALKYRTAVNRWTHLEGPVGTLLAATGGRAEQSEVWRELLAGYGIGDVASVVFRDRFGCWGFLELWRETARGPFDDAEVRLLSQVAGPVTEALRRCQAHAFTVDDRADPRIGPAVLVLSPGLEVRAQTVETERYLRQLVPPDGGHDPIPAGAYNVAAQLLAVEAGVDAHPPLARVNLPGGVWLTLRAARIGAGAGDERDIAVTIESATPAERLGLFVRSCGLSAREAELIGHLAAGADTHRIAETMFLSEHTVQDHLKSIFAKTGVRNRRTLLTRAVGR